MSRPSTGSPPCPPTTALATLVDTAKLRWRIERDYQELKQELSASTTYEGRGWRGFHHHAALCIAAYGFLVAEEGPVFPPQPLLHPVHSGAKSLRPGRLPPARLRCGRNGIRPTRSRRSGD